MSCCSLCVVPVSVSSQQMADWLIDKVTAISSTKRRPADTRTYADHRDADSRRLMTHTARWVSRDATGTVARWHRPAATWLSLISCAEIASQSALTVHAASRPRTARPTRVRELHCKQSNGPLQAPPPPPLARWTRLVSAPAVRLLWNMTQPIRRNRGVILRTTTQWRHSLQRHEHSSMAPFLFTVFIFLCLFSGCICVYVCALNCIVLYCCYYGVIKHNNNCTQIWRHP